METIHLHLVRGGRARDSALCCEFLQSCAYYRCRRDSQRSGDQSAVKTFCLDAGRWRFCLRYRLQHKFGVVEENTIGPA